MDGKVRLCSLLFLFCVSSDSKMIPMKVVDEPSSYGFNFNANQNQGVEDNGLKMRVTPSHFSGPIHLYRLKGKCFTMTNENYKYEFCPFSNVTQHEQSIRWNPYSGVLGVWQEWEIVNNTFVAMVMKNGDDCGTTKRRSVRVILKCGKKEEIRDVSEPKTCSYEMVFKTSLVCHNHSLLVYPTLNESLRHEWDLAYSDYHYGYITLQGYNKAMRSIFLKAGFYVDKNIAVKQEETKVVHTDNEQLSDASFYLLPQCNQEYKKLKEEYDHLKAELLQLKNQLNATSTEELPTNKTLSHKGLRRYQDDDDDYDME